MKISFDFDGCLSIDQVESFANTILSMVDIEVWVITARNHSDYSEVKEVSDRLGIPGSRVIFTCGEEKYKCIKDLCINTHIDDDWHTIKLINSKTSCLGVTNFGNPDWRQQVSNSIH